MTKSEALEQYFLEFCTWCASTPEGKSHELVFWLDHHYPTEDNFWEWYVKFKAAEKSV
jgi:hypothetical protein